MSELDVERLAHAYNNVVVAGGHGEFVSMRRWAEVAAEYARLAESRPSDELAEAVARAIYDAMRENDPEGRDRPWVPGGNSRKQEEARSRARAALAEADTAAEDPE
jgi:hypothetical protein